MKARQIVLLGLIVAIASILALAENAGAFSALGHPNKRPQWQSDAGQQHH